MASLYSSSSEGSKGGDIYYLSVCESDLLTRIVVADVAGHGKSVSAISQFVYDAMKLHMNEPAESRVLTEINRLAVNRGHQAITTAAVICFYKSDEQLSFAYAGHHPVLVKREQDNDWLEAVVREQMTGKGTPYVNLPLAVKYETIYTQERMSLDSGDRLFLYTDGLIEAPNMERSFYGIDRLKSVLEEYGRTPLQNLRSAVLRDLYSHAGNDLNHDDVTFLAIEIR
jgi:sigma-B regulation protein RsbU (phosphoserine phosphatase)